MSPLRKGIAQRKSTSPATGCRSCTLEGLNNLAPLSSKVEVDQSDLIASTQEYDEPITLELERRSSVSKWEQLRKIEPFVGCY